MVALTPAEIQSIISQVNPNAFLASRYVAIALGTVVTWEHIVHFHNDVAIFTKLWREGRQSFLISDAVLLTIRYSLVWYLVAGFVLFFGRPNGCEATKVNMFVASIIGSLAIDLLFLYRIWIIWARKKWPIFLLSAVVCADCGCWVAVAVQWQVLSAKNLAIGPTPSCIILDDFGVLDGWQWVPRLVFDGLVLILTLWRLYQLPRVDTVGTNDMRNWIAKSNITFFAATFTLYTAGFIGNKLSKQLETAIIWSICAQVLPLIVVVRVILHTPSRREEMRQRQLRRNTMRSARIPPSARGSTVIDQAVIRAPSTGANSTKSAMKRSSEPPFGFQPQYPAAPPTREMNFHGAIVMSRPTTASTASGGWTLDTSSTASGPEATPTRDIESLREIHVHGPTR